MRKSRSGSESSQIGMSYKILPTKEFSKDFGKLDQTSAGRIKKKIEEAAGDPARCKHLHYDLSGSCGWES